MSDRIFALAWLAVVAGVAWLGWKIEAPYNYEPIGPRAYPLLLCALMAGCAAWLLVKPDAHAGWPRGTLRVKAIAFLAVLFGWALAFEPLGFMATTAIATTALGRVFGGSWKASFVSGLVSAFGLYLLFDRLLGVNLPLGRFFAA